MSDDPAAALAAEIARVREIFDRHVKTGWGARTIFGPMHQTLRVATRALEEGDADAMADAHKALQLHR